MSEKNYKILIVDDEAFMRTLLTEYLQPEGYFVSTAENGEQAWELLQCTDPPFDVVISDRNMPKMHGVELLQKIKADIRLKEIPIIFQTALVEKEEVLEGIRAGVYYYLKKPYDPKLLMALVVSAINEKNHYQALRAASLQQQAVLEMLHTGEFRCQTLSQIRQLTPFLAQLSPQPERAVIGLSELLINAIEHGNLGISYQEKSHLLAESVWSIEVERRLLLPENSQKWVDVEVERLQDQVTYLITDQGPGFDPSVYMDFDPNRVTHSHGRGIAMSRLFSFDKLEFLGNGNQVRATQFK
jgi:CheY-like chemotaxis protein